MSDQADRPPAKRSAMGEVFHKANERELDGLVLQTCDACARVHYPPAPICRDCLGERLSWRTVSGGGHLIASTTLYASSEPYFRDRLPWRVCLVRLDAGPRLYAHMAANLTAKNGPVEVIAVPDAAHRQVLLAHPPGAPPPVGSDLEQIVQEINDE